MALIPEDGTGLATADTYVSLVDADAYFAAHGSPAAWVAATDATKESALRYAANWLDNRYTWRETVLVSTQARAWPRGAAIVLADGRQYAGATVPQLVKDAQCEAALLHLSGGLNAAPARGGMVKRTKVGPIEEEFFAGAPGGRSYGFIDSLIGELALYGGGSLRAFRLRRAS